MFVAIIDTICGLALTLALGGMVCSIREMIAEKHYRDRLRRMRDRYYGLYCNALTECDREYFYGVYERCESKLNGEE